MDTSLLDGFEVGGQHEVKGGVMVRKSDRLDSKAIAELYPGAVVQIMEICPPCRARIQTTLGADTLVDGWITLMNKDGEPLLGKLSGEVPAAGAKEAKSSKMSSKIKAYLEAAKAGNVM